MKKVPIVLKSNMVQLPPTQSAKAAKLRSEAKWGVDVMSLDLDGLTAFSKALDAVKGK